MNKVITINLNGKAYQLEEAGYAALKEYLDAARAALAQNPDESEIMADLEQAIADKCDARLSPHKNVVTLSEVEAIIKAMGPVEGGAEREAAREAAEKKEGPKAPRRLYRILEGKWFSGICAGLAAYFDVDVVVVRGLFVLLTIVTGGVWIIPYVVFSFVIPAARTEEEFAEAHGETPLTARDFVNRIRNEGARFAHEGRQARYAWRRKMRDERRAWRHAWRDEWHEEWNKGWQGCGYGPDWRRPAGGFAQAFGGIMIAALSVLWIVAVWSFLTTGLIFGHVIGAGYPVWTTLIFVTLVYLVASSPFKALAFRCGWHHHHGGGFFSTVVFLIVVFYVVSLLSPAVHGWWSAAIAYIQTIR